MPDTQAEVAQAQDEPFDIGDTSLQLSAPEKADERPRNADGTFAKATKEEIGTPAPEAPKHPDWLLAKAAELGMSQEETDGMTPAALNRAVLRQLQNHHAFQAQLARERAVVNQPRAEPKPEPNDDLDLGDLENELEPRVVGSLKKTNQALKDLRDKEIKELRQQLAQLSQREAQRQQSEIDTQIDAAFDKLGDDYKTIFGDGSIHDLPEGADERNRRFAVVSQAMRAGQGSIQARFAKAAKSLFPAGKKAEPKPEESEYLAGAEANGKKRISEKDWNGAGVGVPTQRKSPPLPKGEALAVRNLTEKLRKETPISDAEELDGIPD